MTDDLIQPRGWHYPRPTAVVLSDDQRNQLAELQHEACEHHCADCGRCDWEPCNPPGATRDVPMIEVDGEMFCEDCDPRDQRTHADDYHDGFTPYE